MKRVTYFHPSATRTVIGITGLLLLFCCCASSAFATLSISSLSPTSGAVGASVTISGSGFGSSQGSSTVKFNGITATATSWKNTTIVATVPAGATTGNVVVAVGSNSSNGVTFTVVPAPSITSLSPASVAIGGSVTITGSNFGATQGSGTVKFNGTTATVTTWSATSIAATVPTGATNGNVVVFASGVNSNGAAFTIVPAPSITSLSVTTGTIGTAVTISGSNFGSPQGSGTVSFNGVLATIGSWSATSIQTAVPSTASTGNVVVFANGVNSNGKTFTVIPVINTLWGNSAVIGAKIFIQGSGFGSTQGTSTVTFNSGKTATIAAWGPNYITAYVPSGASTGNVTVTVAGTTSNGVTFTPGSAPIISSISPSTSSPPQPVVITGSFFGALMQDSYVSFNGLIARPTSWSSTQIVTPVPYNVGAGGPVTVVVATHASNPVTFTASYGETISGKVSRSSDGTPVVGAQVQISSLAQSLVSTTTAGDGSYSLVVSSEQLVGLPNNTPFTVDAYINGNLVVRRLGVLAPEAATTTVNLVVPVPTITKLSPSSGPVGSTVTITGTNFGLNPGLGTVTFNGVVASPTSWSNSTIVVPVPAGATTGPVVISEPTISSNNMAFAVGIGAIIGTVTNASGGTAISGATIQALQSNAVQGTATSASDGTYTVNSLSPGTYDVRVSASSFGTSLTPGNTVSAGGQTTVNAALSAPGTISGKVTQSDGVTAIVGAAVVATQTGDSAGSATTDSTGSYSIQTLSAGSYVVQASASGFNPQTQAGAVTANNNTTVNLSLPGQSTINYAYDPAGRLVGVSDSGSNTAKYGYDLVGNLLSIATNPTSQTSVIGFDPQTGSSGTQVTISGTGFSSTITQDSVSFNGTPAIVTSASVTQLVVTVPSGTTTGPIAVTTPNGSATSSSSFMVGGNANAPTVSGFSPTIAVSGTALTINGTNFDPTPANDLTLINRLAKSTISSATQSSLSTTIPSTATTGYVSVTAPSGKAISNSYLFVVPTGYTTSQVVDTGSLPFQTPTTLNFSALSQISLRAFDGTAGQRVTLYLSTDIQSNNRFNVTLISPTNVTLTNLSIGNGAGSYPKFSPDITLPTTGTYTVLTVVAATGTTNGLALTLYNVPPDVTATMTVGGPPLTVSTSAIGQNAKISFPGSLGQRVSLALSNSSYTTTPGVGISGPDLTSAGGGGLPPLVVDPPITLPQSGTYTILLQPVSQVSGSGGSITLNLYSVPPDVAGSVTVNGASLPVPIMGPGQNAQVTFTGTANQSVTVQLTGNTICQVLVKLVPPGGNGIWLQEAYSCGGNFSLPSQTLSSTGTYTILVDPQGTATGNISVAVTSP
jgi:YD repeat-containing protein